MFNVIFHFAKVKWVKTGSKSSNSSLALSHRVWYILAKSAAKLSCNPTRFKSEPDTQTAVKAKMRWSQMKLNSYFLFLKSPRISSKTQFFRQWLFPGWWMWRKSASADANTATAQKIQREEMKTSHSGFSYVTEKERSLRYFSDGQKLNHDGKRNDQNIKQQSTYVE